MIGVLPQLIDLTPDFLEAVFVDLKYTQNGAFRGFEKLNSGRLIPDNLATPEVHRHSQAVERVAHRIEPFAEMRAEQVAVVPAGPQLDFKTREIFAKRSDTYTHTQVRRVESDPLD